MFTQTDTDAAITDLQVLITAQEAYPVLEQAVLDAESEISACFRIFDLKTRLRSDRALQIGKTWFDLLRHTLDRGVAIRLVVSDFDAVAAVPLHRHAWQTQRQLAALREVAKPGAKLTSIIALHPARVGFVPRLALFPVARRKLREIAQDWLQMTAIEKGRFRAETPGLHHVSYIDQQDQLRLPLRMSQVHPATHHQKLAVFDGTRVYIGGLDLNERRYDTKKHARAPHRTWHDVQVMASGPVAKAALRHLDSFLDSAVCNAKPPPSAPGFLRTLSCRHTNTLLRLSPRTLVHEIETAHLRATGQAARLIYLETQFLRHMPLARALAQRAAQVPDLKLIIVLPAAPEDVAFTSDVSLDSRYGEHRQVSVIKRLRRAFGPDRMLIASPVQPRKSQSEDRDALENAPMIYVHSKVSIFDDSQAIVSSANLNGRSMRWDTEAGLHITQSDHVAAVRKKVMGCWLPKSAGPEFLDCEQAFGHWAKLVRKNTNLPPEQRQGFLVEYDSDAARDIAVPVPGIPADLV